MVNGLMKYVSFKIAPFLHQEINKGGDGQSAEVLASGTKRTYLWELE